LAHRHPFSWERRLSSNGERVWYRIGIAAVVGGLLAAVLLLAYAASI
jgi:hypothetical protein